MSPIGAILFLLQLYVYVIIIDVILSWLINFQVINSSNQVVRQVHAFTFKLTNPAYRWIRQVVPPIGGIDLSPLFLIIGIQILQWAVVRMF